MTHERDRQAAAAEEAVSHAGAGDLRRDSRAHAQRHGHRQERHHEREQHKDRMSLTCSVYGLGLSINVPLAGLRGLAPVEKVDVRIEVGELPSELDTSESVPLRSHSSNEADEHGTPVRRVARSRDGAFFRIDYCDGTRVIVNAAGQRVWARGATPDLEDTATYLLGPVLGMVLRLRGVNCLHASAVPIADRACAFVGPSGSGNSSIAAAFARRGHAVLCYDVTPVAERRGPVGGQP